MKYLHITTILLIFTISTNAQKIFSVSSQFDADVKVYVTDSQFDAELLVYRVDSQFDAGDNDGKWFFVDSQFDAKKKIGRGYLSKLDKIKNNII